MEFTDRTIVRLEIDGGARLSKALVSQLENACDRAEDSRHGAIVIASLNGKRPQLLEEKVRGEIDTHLVNQWERALRRLERLAAATIAVAEGICEGTGLAVLLTTDYRMGAENLRLSLTGPGGDIEPGMAVYRLANQIGVARSRQLALFGAQIPAARALELGLIDEIVDDSAAGLAAFERLVRRVDFSELAMRRQLLLEAPARSFESALGTHLAACDRSLRKKHSSASPLERKVLVAGAETN